MVDKNASVTPSFHSDTLRDAVARAREVFEDYEQSRDRVSSDIKALEAYLSSTGVREFFRFPLGKVFESEDSDSSIHASLEYGGGAEGKIFEMALVWGETTTGKWRLLLETSRWDGSIEIDVPGGPYFWDEKTLERQSKPLIEAKLDDRIRASEHLARFVHEFAIAIAVDPAQKQALGDEFEVPF